MYEWDDYRLSIIEKVLIAFVIVVILPVILVGYGIHKIVKLFTEENEVEGKDDTDDRSPGRF
jgi:cell division protein FtsL